VKEDLKVQVLNESRSNQTSVWSKQIEKVVVATIFGTIIRPPLSLIIP
jgi:hypothetical protein